MAGRARPKRHRSVGVAHPPEDWNERSRLGPESFCLFLHNPGRSDPMATPQEPPRYGASECSGPGPVIKCSPLVHPLKYLRSWLVLLPACR
jgi:hypothetical protein